jgi:hypothetical protein
VVAVSAIAIDADASEPPAKPAAAKARARSRAPTPEVASVSRAASPSFPSFVGAANAAEEAPSAPAAPAIRLNPAITEPIERKIAQFRSKAEELKSRLPAPPELPAALPVAPPPLPLPSSLSELSKVAPPLPHPNDVASALSLPPILMEGQMLMRTSGPLSIWAAQMSMVVSLAIIIAFTAKHYETVSTCYMLTACPGCRRGCAGLQCC